MLILCYLIDIYPVYFWDRLCYCQWDGNNCQPRRKKQNQKILLERSWRSGSLFRVFSDSTETKNWRLDFYTRVFQSREVWSNTPVHNTVHNVLRTVGEESKRDDHSRRNRGCDSPGIQYCSKQRTLESEKKHLNSLLLQILFSHVLITKSLPISISP